MFHLPIAGGNILHLLKHHGKIAAAGKIESIGRFGDRHAGCEKLLCLFDLLDIDVFPGRDTDFPPEFLFERGKRDAAKCRKILQRDAFTEVFPDIGNDPLNIPTEGCGGVGADPI